jgi:DNA repair exonuclease SbcCD nuclease subunit
VTAKVGTTKEAFRYRFLQVGDIHIGRGRSSWGEALSIDRAAKVFDRIIAIAKSEKCHAVLITGDVFDTKSVTNKERQVLVEKLAQMAGKDGVDVYIIPGNHDLTKVNESNLDFLVPLADCGELPRLHIAPANEPRIWSTIYPTLSIIGLPVGMSENQDFLERFCASLPSDGEYILMGHGTIRGCVRNDSGWRDPSPKEQKRLSLETAAQSAPQVVWWAYGDIHKRQALPTLPPGSHGWYAGSPIQQDFGEKPDRGGLVVALDCKREDHKWHYVGKRYVRIDDPSTGIDPLITVLHEEQISDLPKGALLRLARGLVLSEARREQVVRDYRVVEDETTKFDFTNTSAGNIVLVDGYPQLQVFDPLLADLGAVEDQLLADMPESTEPSIVEEAKRIIGLAVDRFRNRTYVS